MSTKLTAAQDALLCSFVISSRELRYIVRAEREIYLRYLPPVGPLLRGEIPECGAACFANLGQILLEFALSCEGDAGEPATADALDHFGRQLGTALIGHLSFPGNQTSDADRLIGALACVLNSLGVRYQLHHDPARIRVSLEQDPLQLAAAETGIRRNLQGARRAFHALCVSLPTALAADWSLTEPSPADTGDPIRSISLIRSHPRRDEPPQP